MACEEKRGKRKFARALLALAAVISSFGQASAANSQLVDPEWRCDPEWHPPRPGTEYTIPIRGEVSAHYDAPEDNPYVAGHRGIDIAWEGVSGNCLHAANAGVVSFSGTVVGNLTISIEHIDGVKTTYSYLTARSVVTGQPVTRGQPVGYAGEGHPDSESPGHIHFSARRNGVYFNPLRLLLGKSFTDLIELVE